MISETAGGGVVRQDVQEAIERELAYRLGEGDVTEPLARWEKELLLTVINAVKGNACLSQLHARAAVKAGAKLDQVLQVILYIELTGMVKWVMVGHGAYTAAEADVPESERSKLENGEFSERLDEIKSYMLRDGSTGKTAISAEWSKLAELAPGILDGYVTMRQTFVRPDPPLAVSKKLMELVIVAADIVQLHPRGSVSHMKRFMKCGGTVAELVEAVALTTIEIGVHSYKCAGLDVLLVADQLS